MSRDTKGRLSDALIELLENKPMNKITIGEVSSRCSVSRMTFYYYFKDMNELVASAIDRKFEKYASTAITDAAAEAHPEADSDWTQALWLLFNSMRDNREFVLNVFRSIAHDRLFDTATDLLGARVMNDFNTVTRSMDISENDKLFVSRFFTRAIVATCFAWIAEGMDEDAIGSTVERCHTTLHTSVMPVLHAFEKPPAC